MEESSILKSIRMRFSLDPEDSSFDSELIPAINTALYSLYAIGFGDNAFTISGINETWSELFLDKTNTSNIKSFIYFKTRLEFDPPQASYFVSAIKEQLSELSFQISVEHDLSLKEQVL